MRFSVNNIIYGEHSFVRRIYHSNRLRCACWGGGEGGGVGNSVCSPCKRGGTTGCVKNNAFGNRRRAAYGRTGRFITSGIWSTGRRSYGRRSAANAVSSDRIPSFYHTRGPHVRDGVHSITIIKQRGVARTADLSSSRRISFTGVYTAYTYIYLFTSIAPPAWEGGMARGAGQRGRCARLRGLDGIRPVRLMCKRPPGEFRGLAAKSRSNGKRDGS